MSDKIVLKRDELAGFARLTFVNPIAGGDHVPGHMRDRPRDSWAEAEFWFTGPGVTLTLSEGWLSDAGNGTSRRIGMSLPAARARELHEALGAALFGRAGETVQMSPQTNSFWTRFRTEAARIKGTPEGQAFVAAGFDIEMTGGGCMAWSRAARSHYVWITDAEGFSVELGDGDDQWMLGLYAGDDGESVGDVVMCGRDPAAAIAKAEELLRRELAAEYVERIGYDPFDDDPTNTIAVVAQLLTDYDAERAPEVAS
jgi:hypothetical protein